MEMGVWAQTSAIVSCQEGESVFFTDVATGVSHAPVEEHTPKNIFHVLVNVGHVNAGAHRGQNGVTGPLELKFIGGCELPDKGFGN